MQNFEKIKGLFNQPFPKLKIEGTDIPLFAKRTEIERVEDKYEKADFEVQNLYTGIFAYGYQTMHVGGSESLYRTISSIILSQLDRGQENLFLDLGCGTGRTLYDLADLYSYSRFIGLDYSYNMLRRANEILLNKLEKPVHVDLSHVGYSSKLTVKSKNLSNVNLIQGSASKIPFKNNSFDCLTNTFLIDRSSKIDKNIQESVRVLKKGGLFILTDPMNFRSVREWSKFKPNDKIVSLIAKSRVEIKEYFSDLIYREMSDASGNYRDWRSLVVWGVKK